ncbi:MAG: serine/threonine protein kinase [Gammaproteobacteria bacterium]|nr:serine/threonine protein kinase [Gammaproteobacteria bacterium]
MENHETNTAATPYYKLAPETVIAAVEQCGYLCDGRMLALNSYENRVYQVGIEDASPIVVKFYRPQRWTDAAILEEHEFAQELDQAEIPIVAPLVINGLTLQQYQGFRYALYPRRGGRHPDLEKENDLEWVGRFLGRIHMVGAKKKFRHRPRLDVESFGTQSYQFVLEHGFVPKELQNVYRGLAEDVIKQIEASLQHVGPLREIRLHGDCHRGNILWTDTGPHFVDLDDSRTGPAIQDLWMLLAGDRPTMAQQLGWLLQGYQQFAKFNYEEIALIEALRTLRLMHYSAWLARRWDDPAFPMAFPWFNSSRYWEEQILTLREQSAAMDELPLAVEWMF